MADLWHDFVGKLGEFAGKWPGYATVGTSLLYLFGYLALRFQLYTYGVSTNLDAFDEKYFFAGCRFLLFLGMTIPSILLILAVVMLLLYGLYRAVPASLGSRSSSRVSTWLKRPYLLRVVGCLLPLLLIQGVLRQCVLLSNMLLRDHPPEYWISSVLLGGDFAQALYFAGLVLGTGLTVAVLACAVHVPAPAGGVTTLLTGLMIFLVAVEFLLLPVNYGILVGSTSLPRVAGGKPGEADIRGQRVAGLGKQRSSDVPGLREQHPGHSQHSHERESRGGHRVRPYLPGHEPAALCGGPVR